MKKIKEVGSIRFSIIINVSYYQVSMLMRGCMVIFILKYNN